MPEDRVRRSMLLDFYGDLLTARQRECYELHFNEDLSLSEIAEQCGITRQGAWDNIRRASDTMEKLEEKTGLIQRTLDTDRHLRHLEKLLNQMKTQLESAVSDRPDADDRLRGDSNGGIVRLLHEACTEVQVLLKTDN